MKSEIVLFYDSKLPEGSPNATRIVSLAKGFMRLNYHVVMVGLNKSHEPVVSGEYEGIPYCLLTFEELDLLGGLNRIKRARATALAFQKWLEERQKQYQIKAIVYSCSMNGSTGYMLRISKKKRIPIIYNWVEWFQLAMFPGLFGVLRYFAYLYEFHIQFPRFRNIIAISSLLEEYAKKRGCNTVRIPTIVDISSYFLEEKKQSDKLILSYAGKIANKDLMVNVFRALELLSDAERNRIELHLYGVYEEDLLTYAHESDKWTQFIGKNIICEGFIPYSSVRNEIQKSDFTVLLRKQWRNANAGFPTKVGESMAAGVPVIANLTSDIGLYLHDGVEGIVSENETPKAFADALKKALNLDITSKERMRSNARKQAESGFNYMSYLPELNELIDKLELSN